jgi:hypothetical protein
MQSITALNKNRFRKKTISEKSWRKIFFLRWARKLRCSAVAASQKFSKGLLCLYSKGTNFCENVWEGAEFLESPQYCGFT